MWSPHQVMSFTCEVCNMIPMQSALKLAVKCFHSTAHKCFQTAHYASLYKQLYASYIRGHFVVYIYAQYEASMRPMNLLSAFHSVVLNQPLNRLLILSGNAFAVNVIKLHNACQLYSAGLLSCALWIAIVCGLYRSIMRRANTASLWAKSNGALQALCRYQL